MKTTPPRAGGLRIQLLVLLLLSNTIAPTVDAGVIIYPTFSEPIVAGESLVFSSADGDRLIVTDRNGRKRWEHSLGKREVFGPYDDTSIYVQRGRRVYRVAVTTGKEQLLGSIEPKQLIRLDTENRVATSVSSEWARPLFVMRDFVTLRPLWKSAVVESVVHVTEAMVIALTAERQYQPGGSYTSSSATLRAFERITGRELWALPLRDSQAFTVRGEILDSVLAIIEGSFPSHLRLIDMTSGKVIREISSNFWKAQGFSDIQREGDRLHLLETMKDNSEPDVLRTVTFPDLSSAGMLPLPARENLFFHRSDNIIVTVGIYSIAAFDRASRSKKWEINRQLLTMRPVGGQLYASYSDSAGNRALIERIDLESGSTTLLYEEPLPKERPPSKAEQREQAKWERERRAEETRRAAREARSRPKVEGDICLRYDSSGMLDIREYLRLRKDGTLEYVDGNVHFPPLRMLGKWRRTGTDSFEISGTKLVRDIEGGNLDVAVGVRANLALLPDLRDTIQTYLQTHPDMKTIDDGELEKLKVWTPDCPREALSYCDVQGGRYLRPSHFFYPPRAVTREDLEKLLKAILDYMAEPDPGAIRFVLEPYRSYAYARFIDPHSIWDTDAENARQEIDSAIDFRDSSYAPKEGGSLRNSSEPSLFRLSTCADYEAALLRLGKIEESR